MTFVLLLVGLFVVFGSVVFFGAPYLPSLPGEVRRAFSKLYPLGKNDVVVDLGSGDGTVLIEAVKRGAAGYGFELNPVLVLVSKVRLRGRARVEMANMWRVRVPADTTLIYVFSVSRDVNRLQEYVEREANRLGRTLRVMTFGAELPGLQPAATLKAHSLYEIAPLQRTNHKL